MMAIVYIEMVLLSERLVIDGIQEITGTPVITFEEIILKQRKMLLYL